MRIFGITVAKNEEERYLVPMLESLQGVLNGHLFYDDQSTDATPEIASKYATVAIRPSIVPGFAVNEGAFREAAYYQMEVAFHPEPGDWILVIDCDEGLASPSGADAPAVRLALETAINQVTDHSGVNLEIHEVFGFDGDGTPLVRIDRLWGTIHAPRLFPYRQIWNYYSGAYGVSSVPTHVMSGHWLSTDGIYLMHFGYARKSDQRTKYERYAGGHGHNPEHVASILASDQILIPWDWPYPLGAWKA